MHARLVEVKTRHEGRFVVIGLEVALAGPCALVLTERVGRGLRYVGRFEWGVFRQVVVELRERLRVCTTLACGGVDRTRGVVWVEPTFHIEVT
jgi:hypothetical protein